MRMKHSVYAIISPSRERVADWDTREEAEADAARRGAGFEVLLLDRRKPQPKPIPAGVLVLLQGATEAERERALAIYR